MISQLTPISLSLTKYNSLSPFLLLSRSSLEKTDARLSLLFQMYIYPRQRFLWHIPSSLPLYNNTPSSPPPPLPLLFLLFTSKPDNRRKNNQSSSTSRNFLLSIILPSIPPLPLLLLDSCCSHAGEYPWNKLASKELILSPSFSFSFSLYFSLSLFFDLIRKVARRNGKWNNGRSGEIDRFFFFFFFFVEINRSKLLVRERWREFEESWLVDPGFSPY